MGTMFFWDCKDKHIFQSGNMPLNNILFFYSRRSETSLRFFKQKQNIQYKNNYICEVVITIRYETGN